MYHSEYMSSLYRGRDLVFPDISASQQLPVYNWAPLHVPPPATTNCEYSEETQYEQLSNYVKLGMSNADLTRFLRSYLLRPEEMSPLGYPVECAGHPEHAVTFKSSIEVPSHSISAENYNNSERTCVLNANAKEFVPKYRNRVMEARGNRYRENSSGHDSGNFSDSEERNSDDSVPVVNDPKRNVTIWSQPNFFNENFEGACSGRAMDFGEIRRKKCVRCDLDFYMTSDNAYITQDECVYHWGKLIKVFGKNRDDIYREYTCCRGKPNSPGCAQGKLHVWNGVISGLNGPFENFVRTRPRITPPVDGNYGVYSLNCGMCYTGQGLELAKISVVGIDGRLVYDVYVEPENEIVDYNTRFSGIAAKDLERQFGGSLKSLREVQDDLLDFISAETILIGHSLENDLRVLRIVHSTVIDTAVCFPHYNGLPYRRSLKSLTFCFLNREIQTGSYGHDSYEDAEACMDLMLWRVGKDFHSVLDQSYYF